MMNKNTYEQAVMAGQTLELRARYFDEYLTAAKDFTKVAQANKDAKVTLSFWGETLCTKTLDSTSKDSEWRMLSAKELMGEYTALAEMQSEKLSEVNGGRLAVHTIWGGVFQILDGSLTFAPPPPCRVVGLGWQLVCFCE
jgi:hypothetical protein